MSPRQRQVFFILSLIGLVYFALFFIPNSYGARTDEILLQSSSDEYVTYPNVLRILTPGRTFFETRANLFLYEDYHYGYPFYALSALVLLPVRLVSGDAFYSAMQLNMLLLRQFISVLPMILAAGLLVYVQTRFESPVKSVALFVFLLTIRGVVRNHMWWWHPDALAVLFVALTIFFLARDRLRFGWNFFLAALCCGLAISIKLLGFFFFLTIPVYIAAGWLQKQISLRRAVAVGALFVLVMMVTAVITNPWLFSDEQRARAIQIQAEKSEELYQGYEHDDPLYYSKGPRWWASTLEKWYAHPVFLFYLAGAVVAGAFWGPRRLPNLVILTWALPYSVYLLYFVAVKPDHYWLPVMLPLFSCALIPFDMLRERAREGQGQAWHKAALALVVVALAAQFVLHLTRDVSGNIPLYHATVQQGIAQLTSLQSREE